MAKWKTQAKLLSIKVYGFEEGRVSQRAGSLLGIKSVIILAFGRILVLQIVVVLEKFNPHIKLMICEPGSNKKIIRMICFIIQLKL